MISSELGTVSHSEEMKWLTAAEQKKKDKVGQACDQVLTAQKAGQVMQGVLPVKAPPQISRPSKREPLYSFGDEKTVRSCLEKKFKPANYLNKKGLPSNMANKLSYSKLNKIGVTWHTLDAMEESSIRLSRNCLAYASLTALSCASEMPT